MRESYRRDTAFLYPDLEKCTSEERVHTLELITQITAIVTAANSEIMELVDGGNFSFVNCMPTVYMECVSDVSIPAKDYESVRICVVQFEDCDYTKCYEDLISAYRSGVTKISHLVALDITSRSRKASFSEDKNKQFDTIVTINLDQLKNILVSIMFDISLYHYFGLSNDLADRKRFNEIKYKYLIQKYDDKAQTDNYGHRFPSSPIYLPASLPEIKKLNRRTKQQSRQEIVNEILDSFATFLSESSIAIHIQKDSDGCIVNVDNSIRLDLVSSDLFNLVEKIVHKESELKAFLIVFLKDSTGNVISKVLEYSENGKVPCWVTKSNEKQMLYKIVSVKQGGDEA